MTCSTCPNCGYDLHLVESLRIGELSIEQGAAVYWKGQRVKLTSTQVLLVCAIARAEGASVTNVAMLEAMGTDVDRGTRVLDCQISKTRRAFKEIDPSFNRIDRKIAHRNGGSTRWRVED